MEDRGMSTFRRVGGPRGEAAAGPLWRATQERVLLRLREATKLAERRALSDARRLRDLLEDAREQSEAFLMVLSRSPAGSAGRGARLAAGGDACPTKSGDACPTKSGDACPTKSGDACPTKTGDAGPTAVEADGERCSTLLSVSALGALADTEPVREFRLIPFGFVRVERPMAGESFEFTRRHAEQAVAWFQRLGRKLAIDYEHQSFDQFNTREDGLRPAAGWISGLELREDGLWAVEVSWTDRARALIRAGEYRYFSPVIYWSDEGQSDLIGLGPVALTNDPAMQGVESLTAASRGGGAASPVTSEADEDTVILGAEHELSERLGAAEREITALRRQLAGRDADAFVERGLRLGKIVDANSLDWREDYLRDAQAAEARLKRSPVLYAPGRLVNVEGRLGAEDRRRTAVSGVIEAADLAAFERAVAAGRVREGR
jgi:hypothetical protein